MVSRTRPQTAPNMALGMQGGRPPPVFERHEVYATTNVLHYMNITHYTPGPERYDLPPYVQHFQMVVRKPRWVPVPCGRPDGKIMGGRVGRSRGLGGNPIAWRPEGPSVGPMSEQKRSFRPATALPRLPDFAGTRTDVWSRTEGCIHGSVRR